MPDSLQHLADTIFIKQGENLDLLNKVDAFYNSAWSKLIIIGTVAFAIVGIVIPLAIQWYQKRVLKISESILKNELTENLAIEKQKIIDELHKIIATKIEIFDQKIMKTEASANAKAFHLQGNSDLTDKNYLFALGAYLEAAKNYGKCGNFSNLQRVLQLITLSCLPKLSMEEVNSLKVQSGHDINAIIKELNGIDINGSLLQFTRDLRSQLNKIPKTNAEKKL